MLNFLFIPMILNYMTAGHFGEFQITEMIFQKKISSYEIGPVQMNL